MIYAVTRTKTALDQLAAIWNASADQAGVTAAADWLEQTVGRRPLELGESRQSSVVRMVSRPPVGIDYEVIEDDKKVRILRVWAAG